MLFVFMAPGKARPAEVYACSLPIGKAFPGVRAADFAMYLLSPQGESSLKAFGFIPVALPVSK